MSRIVGVVNTSFETKDKTKIEGATIHTLEAIDPKRGTGEAGDRFFLSRAKLATLDFKPSVGQEIQTLYNKYGRITTLRLLDEEVIS